MSGHREISAKPQLTPNNPKRIKTSLNFPNMIIDTTLGRITLSGNEIVLEGRFSEKDAKLFATNLEKAIAKWTPQALAEPLITTIKKQKMISKVKKAYEKRGEHIMSILDMCPIYADPQSKTVTIDARELSKEDTGKLIGRHGRIVNAIEKETGIRVDILKDSRSQPTKQLCIHG